MQATQPRMRRARRSAVLIATLTLMASALTLVATPPAVVAEEVPTAQALQARQLVFGGSVDASGTNHPVVVRKAYRTDVSGDHVFRLTWPTDAHLKLLIFDSAGDLVAKKGGAGDSPKKVTVQLDAGERYKIKVRATNGVATFKLWVRAPESDVSPYFDGMPGWDDIYTYVPFSDVAGEPGDWAVDPADPTRECRYEPHDLANSADEIVTFGIADSWLYPGVLLQGDGYAGGITTVKQLPIRQRAPAELFVNFLDGDITRTVNNPTPANLAEAVGAIIEGAVGTYSPATSVDYEETQTFSSTQMALHLGMSASYMKSGIKAKLDMDRSTTENTLTVYFKESAFTAAMDLPQTPGAFFSDDLTEAILQQQIDLGRLDDEHNVPVYVKSVTYGRILVYSITSTASIEEIEAAVSGVYNGGAWNVSAEALAEYQRILASSQTKLVTVGGSSSAAAAAIASGDFTQYFAEDPLLTEYAPISYIIEDLQGNTAYLGETTEYSVRECRPVQAYMVRVTFDEAFLVSYDDPDFTSGYELDRFFLETHAFDKMYESDPGVQVFDDDTRETCGFWLDEAGLQRVHCMAVPGYYVVGQGGWWSTNEAALGQWYLDIPFDDSGTTGYLDYAVLQLRAVFRDYDAIGPDEWTSGVAGILEGADIWADHLSEHDSTYMFSMNNNGAHWEVYVTIELVPTN